ELARAQAHALADAEAPRIARAEGAALAVIHPHRHLVAALRELRLHLGGARGAEAPVLVALRPERQIDHRADRNALLDVGRHAHRRCSALRQRAPGSSTDLAHRDDLAPRDGRDAQVERLRLGGGEPQGNEHAHLYSERLWMKYVAESSRLGGPSGPSVRP